MDNSDHYSCSLSYILNMTTANVRLAVQRLIGERYACTPAHITVIMGRKGE